MTRLTQIEIHQNIGKTVLYLIGISIFSTYKLFYTFSVEYVVVLISCILGILCTYRVKYLLDLGISSKGSFKTGFVDSIVTEFGLMGLLGCLSLYLVFYKGFWGLYELINEFSWLILVFRLLIIYVGAKLVYSLDKLQTGFKMVKTGQYSVEQF